MLKRTSLFNKQMSSSSTVLPPIFFIVGPPGSSKGTISQYLAQVFNCHHIVAGDLLRNEVKEGTKLGKEVIGPLLADGKIIPSEITIELIKTKTLEKSKQKISVSTNCDNDKEKEEVQEPQGILLDGFPRKIDQSNMFEEQMVKAKAVVYFDCKEEVMLERLLGRGREDDKIEIIRKRFQSNQEQCEPVKEMFAKQNRLHVLDTNGNIEQVCAAAKKLFVEVCGMKIKNDNVEIPKV